MCHRIGVNINTVIPHWSLTGVKRVVRGDWIEMHFNKIIYLFPRLDSEESVDGSDLNALICVLSCLKTGKCN